MSTSKRSSVQLGFSHAVPGNAGNGRRAAIQTLGFREFPEEAELQWSSQEAFSNCAWATVAARVRFDSFYWLLSYAFMMLESIIMICNFFPLGLVGDLRHAENGPSPSRVQRLVSLQTCRCQRRICFSKFRQLVTELLNFLKILWAMSRAKQDAFVAWSLWLNWALVCFSIMVQFSL